MTPKGHLLSVQSRRERVIMTMTMFARPVSSLHKALTCPEDQSAWALAHSLLGEHVRIMQRVSLEHRLLFCSFVDCCCFGLLEDQLLISWERMSVSSSFAPSSWTRALIACVVCPTVVGLVAIVVAIGVMGRIGCLSLLLAKSLSMESHFKASSAVVS